MKTVAGPFGIAAAVLCVMGLAGCVPPKPKPYAALQPAAAYIPIFTAQVSAPSGKPQRVNFEGDINPDCTSAGRLSFNLERPPSHGSVGFLEADDFPLFLTNNPRSKCNSQRVHGWETIYTSQAGFIGHDTFVVSVITAEGQRVVQNYFVTVGPLGPNFHPLQPL